MPHSPYSTVTKQVRILRRQWGGGGTPAPTSAGGSGASGDYFDASQLEYAAPVYDLPQGLVLLSFAFVDCIDGYGVRPGGVTQAVIPFAGSIVGMSLSASAVGSGTLSVRANGVDLLSQAWSKAASMYKLWPSGTYDFAEGSALSLYGDFTVTAGTDAEALLFIAMADTT